MLASDVERALAALASDTDAVFLQRFFKTGHGQYGEGDVFIGVRVPSIRMVCKAYQNLPLPEVQKLISSPVHEYRLAGLILLASKYPAVSPAEQEAIFAMYLQNLRDGRVNNWDLVDVTAEHVVGAHEQNTDRSLLYALAASDSLWQKRAAIISAFRYLKGGDAHTTIELAERLLHDPHDLIQKAVGWQLREVGKRVDRQILLDLLDAHAATMPRTALRYALEHLPPTQKRHFMQLQNNKP